MRALDHPEKHALTVGQAKETQNMADVVSAILDGDTAVFGDGWTSALLAGTRGFASGRDKTGTPAVCIIWRQDSAGVCNFALKT